jgi:hypothetical protein
MRSCERQASFILVVAMAACSKSVSQQTDYMKHIYPRTPYSAFAKFRAYPVSAAFGPHALRLTGAQRRWLLHVMRSRAYRDDRDQLAFALSAGRARPLVVFVDYGKGGVPSPGLKNAIGDCGVTFSYVEGVQWRPCSLP